MRVIKLGSAMFAVTAEIEARWSDVEQASRVFAERTGDGAPYMQYRTDTDATGSIPLDPETPVAFVDVDEADAHHFVGVIVSVLPGDPMTIGRDLMARAPRVVDLDIEGMPEKERLRILERLNADAPRVDHERIAAGTLAGRATPDRPDVPPWGYQQYAEQHPDTSLDELVRVRFPEVFAEERGATVSSIAEFLDDHGLPRGAQFTVDEALDRWRFLHDAGVVRWNSSTRAVEHVHGFGEVFAAQREWHTRVKRQRAPRPPTAPDSDQH